MQRPEAASGSTPEERRAQSGKRICKKELKPVELVADCMGKPHFCGALTRTNYMSNQTSQTELCLTCQHEAHHERTGAYPSTQARQHAILWGCTCDPQDAENAQAWMDLVSQ